MQTLKIKYCPRFNLRDIDLVPSDFEDFNFEELISNIRKTTDKGLFDIIHDYVNTDLDKVSYIMSILVNSGAVIREGYKWKLCDEKEWRYSDFIDKFIYKEIRICEL